MPRDLRPTSATAYPGIVGVGALTEITVARTVSAWRNGSPAAVYAVSISA